MRFPLTWMRLWLMFWACSHGFRCLPFLARIGRADLGAAEKTFWRTVTTDTALLTVNDAAPAPEAGRDLVVGTSTDPETVTDIGHAPSLDPVGPDETGKLMRSG